MSLRFRKSIKIAPGLRLTVGKRGPSINVGGRGSSISLTKSGVYSNIGIPGTGISYRSKIGGSSSGTSGSYRRSQRSDSALARYIVDQRLQEIFAGISFNVNLESGILIVRDADGVSLQPALLKHFWREKGNEATEWLKRKSEEINGDVELLAKFHEDTPHPNSEPEYLPSFLMGEPPVPPVPPEEPAKPAIYLLPKLGFFASLFKKKRALRESKQQELDRDNADRLAKWEQQCREQLENYQSQLQAYQAERAAWDERLESHEMAEAAKKEQFQELIRSDRDIMDATLALAFESLCWPRDTLVSYQITEGGKQVWLDVDLPEIEDLPGKISSVAANGRKLNIKDKPQKQRQLEYAIHIHGIAFRLIGTTFATLPRVVEVVVSGYSQRLDKATGKVNDEYLYSFSVERERFADINFESLDKVDPITAMESFEMRRKMTTTGLFKVVEPFAPRH